MQPESVSFDLLTMAEVARLLHCSKAHVCNIVAGRVRGCTPLPSINLGRRILVRRETLLDWLASSESSGGSMNQSPERVRKSA
jgi:excisionase family DNA binding protein